MPRQDLRRLLLVMLLLGGLALAACGGEPTPMPTSALPDRLPNAASEYCLLEGNQLEIYAGVGETAGYCLFPDGSHCELWAFYRGECGPGTPQP